ncbi:VRR-NUC domain-containing protein [Trinickia dinghuensis]|uniref:phosphodiesterase I n=1 Tax=Trinickia dinghuensis TaxID=2291023 RepID=A0A3D8JZ16_9BURK|nr:VRR-NUC domain-containing protein [Trinickia dinghuensis]RDU97611.1 VRR-NUC domain-containing protein [Trinickia dinghuensis]
MQLPASSPYYLLNFERALAWIAERYDGLLDASELGFLQAFPDLPQPSRALLVRMLMRRGPLFRASRLVYEEIGCPLEAAAAPAKLGWLDADAPLTIDEVFAVATRPELARMFPASTGGKHARKAEWLDAIRGDYPEPRRYGEWAVGAADRAIRTTIDPLCERLRLMFFGNLHQDWSEFVLADLGVYRYESVPFPPSARAFQTRADIDAYLSLHACRTALDSLAVAHDIDALLAMAMAIDIDNAWLETRRAKLLFSVGNHAERLACWSVAEGAYQRSTWPGARHRRIRVLERDGRFDAALDLARQSLREPESEAEAQRIARMMPRLNKAAGQPAARTPRERERERENETHIERETLALAYPDEPFAVEHVARDHLGTDAAPVFYVENGLINSLFGLLCWEAVFAPVPGAFFHPFQRGPADLHAPDFLAKRAEAFARCLVQLDGGDYRSTIRRHFEHKAGLQSPFVFWGMLTAELVDIALDCLPAAHLKLWFSRLLSDIRENRSGLPDLVRFWPREKRYEFIEVKGPGDKLQDNQTRWLRFCIAHGMPVRVLDVRWTDSNEYENDNDEQAAA